MFVDPWGLDMLFKSQSNLDEFLELSNIIFGYDVGYEIFETKDGFVINEESWKFDDYKAVSKVGKALLKNIIVGKDVVKVSFSDDNDITSSTGTKKNVNMQGWGTMVKDNKKEAAAHFIHELAHTYTLLMGYNGQLFSYLAYMLVSGETQDSIEKQYAEAAAITVEQQFRKDLQLEPRENVSEFIIEVNGYGYWPNDNVSNPESRNYNCYGRATNDMDLNIAKPLSLAQTRFIVYDIIRKAGLW